MKTKSRMKKESMEECCDNCGDCCNSYCNHSRYGGKHAGGAVYGLGFVGAAIYYISTAGSFWLGVLGIIKALIWPAFVVFEMLKFLAA